MEKTISIRGTEITFSIWDLGGALLQLLLHIICTIASHFHSNIVYTHMQVNVSL